MAGSDRISYASGFADLDSEVGPLRLPLTGAFPTWLKGTLLRTGPAKFDVGSTTVNHWFDGLAMLLEAGSLRLMDIPVQTNELLAYQYELTPSRHIRMNAPSGLHDDTVIAFGSKGEELFRTKVEEPFHVRPDKHINWV